VYGSTICLILSSRGNLRLRRLRQRNIKRLIKTTTSAPVPPIIIVRAFLDHVPEVLALVFVGAAGVEEVKVLILGPVSPVSSVWKGCMKEVLLPFLKLLSSPLLFEVLGVAVAGLELEMEDKRLLVVVVMVVLVPLLVPDGSAAVPLDGRLDVELGVDPVVDEFVSF